MAGTISESHLSRGFTLSLTDTSRELTYDVLDTDDENEIYTLLAGTAPASYLGLLLDELSAEPVASGVWKCTAKYVRLQNENEYTFDTSGGTRKITQSLATINAYALPGLTAPDFQGAIGVSDDKVEGVEIPAPKFDFSETHLFNSTFVDAGYKRVIFGLTGKVNDATFKGLNAGECLFLGASGTQKGNGQWSITFKFSGSANATGLTVGDITDVDKDGWDYLWIRYSHFEDSDAKALVQRPVSCYVERVIERADFSTLLIGT